MTLMMDLSFKLALFKCLILYLKLIDTYHFALNLINLSSTFLFFSNNIKQHIIQIIIIIKYKIYNIYLENPYHKLTNYYYDITSKKYFYHHQILHLYPLKIIIRNGFLYPHTLPQFHQI